MKPIDKRAALVQAMAWGWAEDKPLSEPGVILGMGSANERRRYIVTSSLIGWAHTQNDPCQPMMTQFTDTHVISGLFSYRS